MVEKNDAIHAYSIDMLLNNQCQEEYIYDPCRSKLCLSVSDLIEYNSQLMMNLQISNFSIKNTIQLLHKIITESDDAKNILLEVNKLTFYSVNSKINKKQIYIIIHDTSDVEDFVISKLNEKFQSLQYKFYTESEANNVIIDEIIRIKIHSTDIIDIDISETDDSETDNSETDQVANQITNQVTINTKRHLNSFYQTDEPIRKKIHDIIYNFVNVNLQKTSNSVAIFLGGEMYIYGLLFDRLFDKKIYITDTESINDDAILNDPSDNSIYNLTNYKTQNFLLNIATKYIANIDLLLSNISKTGLGEQICDQINIIKPKCLILITCNFKVTQRDISMLKLYRVVKFIKISTNYDVFITILELIR